jgi:tetratricopeptide (TPR) repeat protein
LECFDAALEIDPYLITAHHHRGTALTQLGRIDDAVIACNKALELDPGNI